MRVSINDWAEYLLWAEKNLKDLEQMVLCKNYDTEKIHFHITAVKDSLDKTLEWVVDAKQK